MNILEQAFAQAASRLDRIGTGDFRGAFRTKQTVRIEEHPDKDDPGKARTEYVLRFGPGKDDYLAVVGSAKHREDLREILSKVIESPAQLKKIKDLPLEKRPVLAMEASSSFLGACNGDFLIMSPMAGTGYRAAGTFVHEFQHQIQFSQGEMGRRKEDMSLKESVLDDRLCESAAETACYQYLYEMKDKHPQAMDAYRQTSLLGGYAEGLNEYAAAKEAGLPESECVLAAMRGYADNYRISSVYETSYHRREMGDPTPRFGKYADYLHEGLKKDALKELDRRLDGGRLDETAAFKRYTAGMFDKQPTDERIREAVRSPEYDYVTTKTAESLKTSADRYRMLSGKDHPSGNRPFTVRDSGGIRQSTEPEKRCRNPHAVRRSHKDAWRITVYKIGDRIMRTRGFMAERKAVIKAFPYILVDGAKKIKDNVVKATLFARYRDPLPVVRETSPDGRKIVLSLDGERKKGNDFKGALFFKPQADAPSLARVPREKAMIREAKLNAMLTILLKDENLRKELSQHGAQNPLTIAFGKEGKPAPASTIVLDPSKSPQKLANDFRAKYDDMKNGNDRSAQKAGQTRPAGKSFFKSIKNAYENMQKSAQKTAALLRQKSAGKE